MHALVVEGLNPGGEFLIEFRQAMGGLASQAQRAFKTLLNGKDHSFHFAFAKTMVGLAV